MSYRDLCPPCRDLYDRWTVAPMIRRGISIVSIGQDNPRNVVSANRARADDHYALINRQCAGVVENCAAGRHATARDPR
jgi:hypothetical protein